MRRVHVLPTKHHTTFKWKVEEDGEDAPIVLSVHKDEAVAAGRARAKRIKAEFFIHGKKGRILGRDSEGGDSPRRPG